MPRSIAPRLALLILIIVVGLVGPTVGSATAADAPADSLIFPAQTDEGTMGRFSLWQKTADDGNVTYGGSAVVNGTDKVWWTATLTSDRRRLVATSMHIKRADMEVVGSSVLKEGGGEPAVEFMYNGMKVPAPVEKLPAHVLYASVMAPPGWAALSDYLAGHDPETFSYDGKGSDGMNLFDLSIHGQGVGELEVRGKTVAVRSFGVTMNSKQMPEPQEMVIHQYDDGTFFGVATDGMDCFALGGPPSESAVSRNAEVFIDVDGASLGGMLAVPNQAEGPFPGVVLVPGAGHDRHASNGSFALFDHLADEFATLGYATLRYDARDGSPSALAADAAAACRVLADHPEVDGARLVLMGHGEGGAYLGEAAVLALADSLGVGGIGILGTSTLAGDDGYDPRAGYLEAGLPMIAVHGKLDAAVPSDEAAGFKAWMSENGIRGPVIMPKTMNHYLQSAVTGEADEYPTLEAACGKGVAKKLAGFVRSATR